MNSAERGAPETVDSGSPDAMHAKAEGSANINQIRVTMPMSMWGVVAISIAAIILSGIALYEVSQVRMHEQLNAYDLSQLKSGRVAYLQGQVETAQKLIQFYGIDKACRSRK